MVERIAGYFQTLLAAALANPETPVSRLPLLNAGSANRFCMPGIRPPRTIPPRCLHQLFEAQAARTPERPAVRFEDRTLSYRELNEQPIVWRIICARSAWVRTRWSDCAWSARPR